MKYMLLIYFDEQALSETEREACYVESTQLAHEIKSSGQYLAANPLHPTAMATTVRVREVIIPQIAPCEDGINEHKTRQRAVTHRHRCSAI